MIIENWKGGSIEVNNELKLIRLKKKLEGNCEFKQEIRERK